MRHARAALAVLALAAGPAAAGPEVSQFRLPNGMDVVVIEDDRAAVVTHMVWYRVGAADEPAGKSGIAHFLEHLMFKGTERVPEGRFSRTVAENGGVDNAFTSQDYTAYFQRIAADRLGLVMEMEADRMRNLRLTDEAVATERRVILEERAQRTDNSPDGLFGEQMAAALYLNHPYGLPVIGWRHEIEGLTRDDALAFYRRFYAPDNAVLVVAGPLAPDEVRALAERHYGPHAPEGRPPEARPAEPPPRAARRIAMSDARVRQSYVQRQYLVPSARTAGPAEAAALDVLAAVLGGGRLSRFAEALEIGAGIALDTGAWYSEDARDDMSFGVYAVPAEGVDLGALEAALDAEIARIATDGPTAEEVARVVQRRRAARVFVLDDQAAMARLYGAAVAGGRTIGEVDAWPDLLAAVTPEDVRRVAAAYLVAERSVTGWLTGDGEAG